MRPLVRSLAAGTVGGLYGAIVMTVLRFSARRAGVSDRMVPALIEEWLLREPERGPVAGRARHPVADQALHLAYGATWGALSAPALAKAKRGSFLWGVGLGMGLWIVGMLRTTPRQGAMAPNGRRAGAPAQAVNMLAHLLYGLSVQLAARETRAAAERTRSSRAG